jgi:hypothetical protein
MNLPDALRTEPVVQPVHVLPLEVQRLEAAKNDVPNEWIDVLLQEDLICAQRARSNSGLDRLQPSIEELSHCLFLIDYRKAILFRLQSHDELSRNFLPRFSIEVFAFGTW